MAEQGYTGRLEASISPEWELFKAIQETNWDTLAKGTEPVVLDMYRSVEMNLNLQKALASPKLRQLSEKHGNALICRLLGLVLVIYCERFPAKHHASWGAWRLRQTAEWLYETYGMESLRDIMYAFRRGLGTYNQDIPGIMSEYLEWRAMKLEETHYARSHGETSPWPGEFKEKLPERWFLGYLNQSNGNKSQSQHAA
jgi:hypothetical protein